jgi:addiction module HigA family antidote
MPSESTWSSTTDRLETETMRVAELPRRARHRLPTHPGEILREDVLPALSLSVSEAARQLRVTRQTLHRILAGTSGVTPEMAVRLGKFCGNGPEIWLRLQQEYDLWQAQNRLHEELMKIPAHETRA